MYILEATVSGRQVIFFHNRKEGEKRKKKVCEKYLQISQKSPTTLWLDRRRINAGDPPPFSPAWSLTWGVYCVSQVSKALKIGRSLKNSGEIALGSKFQMSRSSSWVVDVEIYYNMAQKTAKPQKLWTLLLLFFNNERKYTLYRGRNFYFFWWIV